MTTKHIVVVSLAWFLISLTFTGCRTPDYTIGQSNICEVHHVAMTRRTVPFAHGMIPMSREEAEQGEWKRRTTYYPHPGDCRPGTDIVQPGEEDRVVVFVCSECERTKKRMAETIQRKDKAE